jgi:small conductance mechanosensitive channel
MDLVRVAGIAQMLMICHCLFLFGEGAIPQCQAQEKSAEADKSKTKVETVEPAPTPTELATPAKVEVSPVASDTQIADRLNRILDATEWFTETKVTSDQGVVFLYGKTKQKEYREWAATLASKTSDVVAVVNHIEVTEQATWDLTPAWYELRQMGRRAIQSLPIAILALFILLLTWIAAIYTARVVDYLARRRMPSALLRQVLTRAVMFPVWIIGIYFVLRVSGLTQMALTVLGGTGLAGLVIGIAFQNIAENFLASILISLQRPFQPNDLVEVAGHKGLIQRVTARGTVLIGLDGNHVQIPNALIYKSVIRNFSANQNARLDFSFAISLNDSACRAQELALQVLVDHPAVLDSPAPTVLIEELAPSMVKLRVFAWINARENDAGKTKSALLRLIKKTLEEESISLADPAREVVFPGSLPAFDRNNYLKHDPAKLRRNQPRGSNQESGEVSQPAEGSLKSDEDMIKQQSAQSRDLEAGPDLLRQHANGD